MKTVKSLLLGSAAGLVAVTAGQAADLPVKAQPVQYVKVCSLYGAGFYYMPGTDMCIKIGGWVRAEGSWVNGGSLTPTPLTGQSNQRTTSNLGFRARGYITADTREQTAYGTARGYIAVGLQSNDVGLQAPTLIDSMNRGYVQFAGFTAGLAQSFYDFFSGAAVSYRAGYINSSDTGDGGWWTFAYTANFGGGFSGSIAAEARRTTQIVNANCTNQPTSSLYPSACGSEVGSTFPAAATYTATVATGGTNVGAVAVGGVGSQFPGNGAYGGQQAPDVVANLRLDQAWGSAQVMGAYHSVNGSYYGSTSTNAPTVASGAHPSDAAGWAVGAGLRVNVPMFGAGDYVIVQPSYTQGALRYLFQNNGTANYAYVTGAGGSGANEAFGVMSDCVYGGSTATAASETGCQLTTAWEVDAAYEHYWTPNFHESFFGSYSAVSYNTSANAMLCAASGTAANGSQNANGGTAATAVAGCNNNWNTWAVGSRLQWDVTKSLYVGVEALYTDLHSATLPVGAAGATFGAYGLAAVGATNLVADQTAWAFTARIHKDFLP